MAITKATAIDHLRRAANGSPQDLDAVLRALVEGDFDPNQQAAITSLTDNSGGTANDTLEDVATAVTGVDGTGSNAASKADVDARLVSIANDIADLAAKQEAILDALRSAKVIAT